MAPLLAVALLLLLGTPALAQNNETMPVYQLHGAGTSNPALVMWRAMDIMMARTKPRIAMSYRSIGSGAGGNEFFAGASAFGCGDVPINGGLFDNLTSRGDPMIHVPYLIGSVSVFHNIPGVGKGLHLPPCVLARIFRNGTDAIETWNHPDILAANPDFPDLATIIKPIRVVHRNPGSSSTYALTHYINKTCPGQWNKAVGVTTEWPADQDGRWKEVTNSQTMMEQIAAVPYSIGYVESGQGINAGLGEVALVNANGTVLTSDVADIATPDFIRANFPIDNLGSPEWKTVNPVYASPENPKQWPMVLGTYLYVKADLTFLGDSGGLLRALIRFLLGDDVAAFMPEYYLYPLPKAIRDAVWNETFAATTIANSSIEWRYEQSTDSTFGQRNFVFSRQRDSYLTNTMAALATDNTEAKRTLMLGDAYQVHGSGSFVSASFLRHAMSLLSSRARVPISMTYRAVGSPEAALEMRDYASMYKSYNHFKVADFPLPSATWSALSSPPASNATLAVLQLPFAVSSLGVYYNQHLLPSQALTLNCTLLARIYGGTITGWADSDLDALNNYSDYAASTLSNKPLIAYAYATESGPTWALTGWLAKACPEAWNGTQAAAVAWGSNVRTSFLVAGVNKTILTPEDMAQALAATPGSLGYLPSPVGAASGLEEAALAGLQGASRALRAEDTDLAAVLSACNDTLASLTADVSTALGSCPYGVAGTWPMPMIQWLFVFRNLAGYGYSGPLLRAYVEYVLSPEGAALALRHGLTPAPESLLAEGRRAVALSQLRSLTVVWSTEPEGSYDDTGSGLYTFSANRISFEEQTLADMDSALTALRSRLAAALPLLVRLACNPESFGYSRLLRQDLQDMASVPVRVLDEMLPATALAASLTAPAAPSHLLITPGPLARADWLPLKDSMSLVQIPASIRPVALLYKGVAGLRLSACTVAKIVKGDIKKWDHADITNDNLANFTLPSNDLALLTAGPEDGDAQALLAWLAQACPDQAQGLAVPSQVTPKVVAKLAADRAFTGLGVAAAAGLVSDEAAGEGLQAAALQAAGGDFVTPMQNAECVALGLCSAAEVAERYAAEVDKLVDADVANAMRAPADPTGDWSGFSLLSPNGPKLAVGVYPVVRLDFFVLPARLTAFGDEGAAVRAAVEYGASSALAERINAALGPYYAGLGQKLRDKMVSPGVQAIVLAQTASAWSILASSAGANASASASALVLTRAPSSADAALPGSSAATAAALLSAGGTQAQLLTTTQVQAMWSAIADAQDKADLAYNIAVAAIVLGLVLSLAGLATAAFALSAARRGGGGSGGSCLSPTSKYEPHVEIAQVHH
ncbi:hypothetical protein HYH03_006348 [Edaphochlamys debaryana]|uniref:PBP domain-containing protein n=1 Tax=Edaphochlamys debaryana TaxID=47281 RepID=A0A835Y632_9CHLO|nr:hypothetical protein HYH03_006348 [Edaphochlamys debaryana]|eukprot:KAG2495398.1 hypothetical protein HYH03_006348 [Edaphochlamys debaryana]